jgi:hypothetical protein
VPEPHVEPKSARRGKKTRQPKPQTVAVPPSERFVWCMTALIISLVGTIVLEAIHIIVTGRLSTELFTVISGLIGSFTTAFCLGPEGRRKRMPKGKPWTVEQERKLQEFVKARLSPERIAAELGQSLDSIKHKIRRLGLEVVGFQKFQRPTTSRALPRELLTVEQAMLSLAAAMKALEQSGLDRTEILRLRSLVQASKIYQEKFAEYADCLRIEKELMELRKEVAGLRKSAEKHAEKRP